MIRFSTIVCVTACLFVSPMAKAERRVAIVVGNPDGGKGLVPLRYVDNDVERVRSVLELAGDFAADDIIVSVNETADALVQRFTALREELAEHKRRTGEPTLFLFYYTGHTLNADLRLGETRLSLRELKQLIEDSQADLRVALIDSCRSGSMTRLKGAVVGPAVQVKVDTSPAQTGQVIITASSATEDAQESDDIQGSFFTYYLTSGLRGAADENGDGKVTLSEAYSHAYAQTVSRTLGSRGGTQHPSYRFDIHGADDIPLTRLAVTRGSIVFSEGLEGTFAVFDQQRQVIVAELHKNSDESSIIGVTPGDYVVKKRLKTHLLVQQLTVRRDVPALVDEAEMEAVEFADDYAKGAVISLEEVLGTKVRFALSGGWAAQSFLSTPARGDYFPNLELLTLRLDLDNFIHRDLGLRFDVAFGGSGDEPLNLQDEYLGDINYDIRLNQLSAGVSMVQRWHPSAWSYFAALGRLGVIMMVREFIGTDLPAQAFSTMTPGVGVEVGADISSWIRVSALMRLHYIFFNVDEPMSLAYLDGGVFLTVVLP